MQSVRIAVLGNCQAGPLSRQIEALVPGVEIERVVTVHLASEADRDADYEALGRSDIILAQRVDDAYRCVHVRNSEIKQHFGDRVVVWPNLYYRGYNPELQYIRSEKTHAPLQGPLGDYHMGSIVDAWKQGLAVEEAVQTLRSPEANRHLYSHVPDQSLEELRQREASCDITISDWVADRRWAERLFFTFNHPTNASLRELARRIIAHVRLDGGGRQSEDQPRPESLGRFQLPINPWIAAEVAPSLDGRSDYQGNDVDIEGERVKAILRPIRTLTAREVVESFYRVYEATS